MTDLRIAKDLALPIDAATGTFGILATKGAGKSNAAVVMFEEMWDAGIACVAVDPKGDWYGLRSSANGDGPGLPIIVFGGRHGDLPLEPTSGALIASLVLEQRISCVLDVSQFTKADTTRFLLTFGRHLFAHADDDAPEPLHLFLEEAHEYLPQVVKGDQAELVNVWQRIVKQGRFKGLGCTMISQRSSVLNKDVLELIDTLVVLRTMGPLSRKAIDAWVKDQDVDAGLLASLPTLKDGEAWVWSPGALGILQRIQFRQRRTFDSGATPKVGQTRKTPTTIADVDLAALKEAMADTIERAKADDPKELRKEIAALRRQLADRPVVEPERVEIEATPAWVFDFIRSQVTQAETIVTGANDALVRLEMLPDRPGGASAGSPPTRRAKAPTVATPAATPVPRPTRPSPPDGAEPHLKAGARRLLQTVARHHPMVLTRSQVATLAKMRKTGGTFGTYWSLLKRAGYIIETHDGASVEITQAGLDRVGVTKSVPLSTDELLAMWRDRLKAGARSMLDHLVVIYPEWTTKADLAAAVGMEPTGGTFGAYLSHLRRNGLADVDGHQIRAAETLFLGGPR